MLRSDGDVSLTVVVPASGTYYVMIFAYASNHHDDSPYVFTVSTGGSTAGYEIESNDTRSSANAVSSGTQVNGQVMTSSDIDYFSIPMSSSGTVTVDFNAPTSFSDDFTVAVADETGTLLGMLRSDGDVSLTVVVPASGTYYVMIFAYASNHHDDSPYVFTVSSGSSTAGYEIESNDTRSSANTVTSGTQVNGQLMSSSDIDYFSISMSSSGTITISFDAPTSFSDDFGVAVVDDAVCLNDCA
jgi:glutamine cyclotransferase